MDGDGDGDVDGDGDGDGDGDELEVAAAVDGEGVEHVEHGLKSTKPSSRESSSVESLQRWWSLGEFEGEVRLGSKQR